MKPHGPRNNLSCPVEEFVPLRALEPGRQKASADLPIHFDNFSEVN
jgi:hypothetical protein